MTPLSHLATHGVDTEPQKSEAKSHQLVGLTAQTLMQISSAMFS